VTNGYFERTSPANSPARVLLDWLYEGRHFIDVLKPAPIEWDEGAARFEILWPPQLDRRYAANDTSIVLRVSCGGRSILLTGDIDEAAQSALLERGGLQADVLVLPHHGSVKSTTRRFIEAVGAKLLVRSSHERMSDTTSGLSDIVGDTPLLNTAEQGAITIEFGPGGIKATSTLPTGSAFRTLRY